MLSITRAAGAPLAVALLAVGMAVRPPALASQAPPPARGALPEAPVRYDADHLSADFHRDRREAVLRSLPAGGVAVLLGGVEAGGGIDDLRGFMQDPYLYYLTGTLEPGTALVLAPGGLEVDGERVQELLFVPPRDPSVEIWTGRRFGPLRAEAVLGVERALPNTRFREVLASAISPGGRTLFFLPFPLAVPPSTELASQLGVLAELAQIPGSALDGATLAPLLDGLREVKTPEELAFLQRAVDITATAHREAMAAMEPGWAEYQIQAVVEYTFRRMGSERPGFPSIVGSGENTVMLHYDTNRRVTRAGDLVVMDIGASYRGYTADVTRTVPVDGRFTAEQRAIYDLVLEAQEAAIAAVRAGASFGEPGEAASSVLARGLARLGLLRRGDDLMGLRRFFPHGTSHYLGLQVHDVGGDRALSPGVVITVEPGIYIPPAEDVDPRWWHIGVRIEDVVLVTDGEPLVLSAAAPKEPVEIEALMNPDRR